MAGKSIGDSSSIAYSGDVTIKVMHGRHAVREMRGHNAGTAELMYFIAHCLGGSFDAGGAPKYIRLFCMEDGVTDESGLTSSNECTVRAVVSNFYPSYSKGQAESEASSVTLTFLIPNTMLKTDKTSFNAVAVYGANQAVSTDVRDCMAWLHIGNPVSLDKGESAMVMWKMTLSNSSN